MHRTTSFKGDNANRTPTFSSSETLSIIGKTINTAVHTTSILQAKITNLQHIYDPTEMERKIEVKALNYILKKQPQESQY